MLIPSKQPAFYYVFQITKSLGKGAWGEVVQGKFCGCVVAVNNIKASFLWNWTFSSRVVLFFTMAALLTSVLELNLSKLELPVEKIALPL